MVLLRVVGNSCSDFAKNGRLGALQKFLAHILRRRWWYYASGGVISFIVAVRDNLSVDGVRVLQRVISVKVFLPYNQRTAEVAFMAFCSSISCRVVGAASVIVLGRGGSTMRTFYIRNSLRQRKVHTNLFCRRCGWSLGSFLPWTSTSDRIGSLCRLLRCSYARC